MLWYFLFIYLMNISATILFLFVNHALAMGLILLIQTILISFMSGMLSYSFWFSYIAFLVVLGGMLVLFIYMTSFASNEMINFSMNLLMFITTFLFLMFALSLFIHYLMINTLFKNSNLIEFSNNLMILKNKNLVTLNKTYNIPNTIITIMLINYLLLTLIVVVKITNIKYGPSRQKF